MTPDHQPVIAAALHLCDVLESLHHDRHAQHLSGLRIRARHLWSEFFTYQSRDVIRTLSPSIHVLADKLKEDDTSKRRRLAMDIIPQSFSPLQFAVMDSEAAEWDDILTAAINAGGKQLLADLELEQSISSTFSAEYLRKNSLQKISSDIAEETVRQLRNAIAEAYTADSDYGQIVNAIQDTYAKFSSSRAEMIAQTELNLAYNAGRNDIAEHAGMNEKAWATESDNPCQTCLDNESEGWIPIGQAFGSGDQFPVAHPSCYCSVDFRLVSRPLTTPK